MEKYVSVLYCPGRRGVLYRARGGGAEVGAEAEAFEALGTPAAEEDIVGRSVWRSERRWWELIGVGRKRFIVRHLLTSQHKAQST